LRGTIGGKGEVIGFNQEQQLRRLKNMLNNEGKRKILRKLLENIYILQIQ